MSAKKPVKKVMAIAITSLFSAQVYAQNSNFPDLPTVTVTGTREA